MSPEYPSLAAFVATLRDPELGLTMDWRDIADVLWLGTSSASQTADAGPEIDLVADDAPRHGAADEESELGYAADALESPTSAPTGIETPSGQRTSEGWRLSDEVTTDGAGLAVDVPPWLAIPGRAEIGRALRPLKRRRLSQRHRILDPDATVEAFCESGVMVPVFRPKRERWFEVALVADESPTMVVWSDTLAALTDLLERHGAFRAVTRWTLTERPAGMVLVSPSGVECQPRQLVDDGGRRLVLVVTDAVGALWRQEASWSAVRLWGTTGPMALLHLLPERMWGQTATGEADVSVRSQRAGEANAKLDVCPPWWWDQDEPPQGAVPVLALDEASIAPWARLVSGVPGVVVRAALGIAPEVFPGEVVPEITRSGPLGDAIRSSVSSTAYRLAALLSAVDVSLPLARVVMARLIPEARQAHLAELLAVGVLNATREGQKSALEFAPGVRSLLQETLTTTDALRTWRAVTPLLTATGRAPQFSLLLADGADALGGDPDPMARIAADLAQRLGLIGNSPTPGSRTASAPAGAFSASRQEDALAAAEDSVTSHRELVLNDPESHLPDLAKSLGDLSGLYAERGRLEEAAEATMEALTTYRQLALARPNAFLPDLTGSLNSIAILMAQLGRYEEAESFYRQALDTFEQFGDQAGAANTYGQLGNLAEARGRDEEAESLYRQALHTFEQLGDQAGAANTYGQLGNLAHARGAFGEAESFYRQALDTFGQLGDQAGAANTYGQLGNLAHSRGEAGDPAGAAAAYAELLTDQLRILGPEHPDTLTTRSNLAYWRGKADDPADAPIAYAELLTDQLRILGPDHPDTLATRDNLAYWRGEDGDPAGAATAYAELLTDQLRILGPDHPDTLATRDNLAYWRGEDGDPAGAATAYAELLTDQLRILGPDHPDTLATRDNLATWRGQAGDPAGAATAYAELLTDQLRTLGPDHPHILATREALAFWRDESL